MKLFRSLKTVASLLALLGALSGATVARANLSYLVEINTAALVGNTFAPFSLDLQSFWGSGAAQTITVSNFSFTGGNFNGIPDIIGTVPGSTGTSLVFNSTSSSGLNDFFQGFDSGVTDIKFNVSLTTNAAGAAPTTFAVQLYGSNGFAATTSGYFDTLVNFSIDGSNTSFISGNGTGAYAGVTTTVTAIPEPSVTAALFGAGAMAFCVIRRRSQKTAMGQAA